MNALRIQIILLIISVFFLSSCEKTIEFDKELILPKIVVNSTFYAGAKYQSVIVQKSRSVLNDNDYFEALPNAKVKLYEDGVFLKELNYVSRVDTFRKNMAYDVLEKIPFENGFFMDSTLNIKAGSTYRLEVANDGLTSVYCETTVPQKPELPNLTLLKEQVPTEYDQDYFKLKMNLDIQDKQNEKNYYKLSVQLMQGTELALRNYYYGYGGGYYGGYGGSYGGGYPYGGGGQGISDFIQSDEFVPSDTIIQQSGYRVEIYSNDPVLDPGGNTDILNSDSEMIDYFADELINTEKYTLNFWTESNRDVYTDLGEYLEIYAIVDQVSEELFKYMVTKQKQWDVQDNPFAEPVSVFSNIEGGIGIFGSVNSAMQSTIIGEYPVAGKTYIDFQTYQQLYHGSPY